MIFFVLIGFVFLELFSFYFGDGESISSLFRWGMLLFVIILGLSAESTFMRKIYNRAADATQVSLAKSRFLSTMSHEIRTPLSVISGLSQMAAQGGDPEKTAECLRKIDSSSRFLLKVVNDILDMTKIEAGQLKPLEKEFSLSDIVSDVSAITQANASEKNIVYSASFTSPAPASLIGDPLRLEQILINLLSNAVKFTSQGGNVALEVKELSNKNGLSTLEFKVYDDGIGIREEDIANLFVPFEQFDPGSAGKSGGTGLGLYIVKNLADLMGGSISVTSKAGEGTCFSYTCSFKQSQPPEHKDLEETPAIVPDSKDFSNLRILIVDDIQINREIVRYMLEDTKVVIAEASGGLEAVDLFLSSSKGHFDLILMDIQMHDMDGLAVTRAIRKSEHPDSKQIRIVAMTANILKEELDAALTSGMNSYLIKPLSPDALLEILSRLSLLKNPP